MPETGAKSDASLPGSLLSKAVRFEASKADVIQRCSHLEVCPGCPRFFDLAPPATAVERLSQFAAQHAVPELGFVAAPGPRYRHRARLAVRGRAGNPKLGLFAAGSHRVVDIPHCAVHHPLINEVAGEVKQLLREQRVPPYSEAAHAGLVRYLQLVVALGEPAWRSKLTAGGAGETAQTTAHDSIQLVVVGNCETSAPLKGFMDALVQRLGSRLHSLFFNGQTDPGNAILGPIWERHFGPECVREPCGGAFVFYPPGAFGQASPELFEAIVQRVHTWVPAGSRVTELFSGVGAIGMGLVAQAGEVCFNERSAEGLLGLQLGINALPEALAVRVRVEPGPAEALGAAFHQDSVVIVDPPRRGLDSELLASLCRTPVSRLIYVSCGLDSFLRDATQLMQSYTCSKLYGYALFPFTEHVETVACFVRNPS